LQPQERRNNLGKRTMFRTRLVYLLLVLLPYVSQAGILFELVKMKQENDSKCQTTGEKCSLYRGCCDILRCIVNSGSAPYCASLSGA
ncbi:unnamed protein product, partial [Candidula unifasciata]